VRATFRPFKHRLFKKWIYRLIIPKSFRIIAIQFVFVGKMKNMKDPKDREISPHSAISLGRVHATFYPVRHRMIKKWIHGLKNSEEY